MNKVILIGRLTRDPEVRYTQSGIAVCTFTLAVDRRFAKRDANDGRPTADFIPIVCWRKLAEICGNNLVKGRRVGVEGSMQVRSYDAQDGSKRYVTEVVADEVEFLDSRGDGQHAPGGQQSYGGGAPQQRQAAPAQQNNNFGPDIPDEEIPF
ncbi:MAG: single-stranded DNA-binding protein [Selenomonas sp.]|uniref:single-stranded DNA-binding protein n=1 Tax=Selenomonas sp. TaxID=2053611 RepID=UPI0025E85E09|nr:single-stranded DNA-binding protein [Selenomonas sp.]MCI6231700.1 single-stranded DNA-binding protein [Selenomonas sp.]